MFCKFLSELQSNLLTLTKTDGVLEMATIFSSYIPYTVTIYLYNVMLTQHDRNFLFLKIL